MSYAYGPLIIANTYKLSHSQHVTADCIVLKLQLENLRCQCLAAWCSLISSKKKIPSHDRQFSIVTDRTDTGITYTCRTETNGRNT